MLPVLLGTRLCRNYGAGRIVGSKNVLTQSSKTLFYRKGFRFGKGCALAIIIPGTILEQWLVIKACVKEDCIILVIRDGSSKNDKFIYQD